MPPEVLTPTSPVSYPTRMDAGSDMAKASAEDLASVHPALIAAFPEIRDNGAQARALGHSNGQMTGRELLDIVRKS